MSNTAKGDAFELRVYNALTDELRNERLWVSTKTAVVFRRKAYHSNDRGSDIVTDVSVEASLPDRQRPSLVWVFECKDYGGSVPVDDVEEFHAKIQQIGEDNTKGSIVTSGALQRSALAFARAKGIGVIRLLPSGQLDYLLDMAQWDGRTSPSRIDWHEFEPALTNPLHRSRRCFFAVLDGYWFDSWYSVLSYALSEDKTA